MNRTYSLRAAVERIRAAGLPLSDDVELIVRKIERLLSNGYNCRDCGEQAHAFMVHDTIWQAAGFKPFDLACLPCLEKALGRPLVIPDDFQPDLRLNAEILWAFAKGTR